MSSEFSNFSVQDQQRIADNLTSFDRSRDKGHGLGYGGGSSSSSSSNNGPAKKAADTDADARFEMDISGGGGDIGVDGVGMEIVRPKSIDYFEDVDQSSYSSPSTSDRDKNMTILLSNSSNVLPLASIAAGNPAQRSTNSSSSNSTSSNSSFTAVAKKLPTADEQRGTRPLYNRSDKKLSSASRNESDDKVLPIYKRIKAGDNILALYKVDLKYYPVIVKSVIHGGYVSANYDVEYVGYDDFGNVSWKEIQECSSEENDYNGSSSNCLTSSMVEEATNSAESALDSYLKKDSFGRDRSLRVISSRPISGHVLESYNKSDLDVDLDIEKRYSSSSSSGSGSVEGATLDKFGRTVSHRTQDKKTAQALFEDASLKYGRKFENLLLTSNSSNSDLVGEKTSDIMKCINFNSINDIVADDFLLEYQGKWSKNLMS